MNTGNHSSERGRTEDPNFLQRIEQSAGGSEHTQGSEQRTINRGTNPDDSPEENSDARIPRISSRSEIPVDHDTGSKTTTERRSMGTGSEPTGDSQRAKEVEDSSRVRNIDRLAETNRTFRPATLRIGTINVQGFSARKATEVRQLMTKHPIDYMVVTETRMDLTQPLAGEGQKKFRVIGKGSGNSGVGLVFPAGGADAKLKTTNRLVSLTLTNGIHIVGAYGPTDSAKTPAFFDEKKRFWQQVRNEIKTAVQTHQAVVFIGDLNADTNRCGEALNHWETPTGKNYVKLSKKIIWSYS